MILSLRPGAGTSLAVVGEHRVARCIPRGGVPRGTQRREKCDERRRFRRTQVLAVRGHVAASLDHLTDELILRESQRDAVESRTSLAARFPKGVAVATLLDLKHERALPFDRGPAAQKPLRDRIGAPRV